jgi:hypothetical protein
MSKLGKDLLSALKEAKKKGLIQLPVLQSINDARNRSSSVKAFSSKKAAKIKTSVK